MIDQQLTELAQTHASAIKQLNQYSEDEEDLGNIGDEADSSNVYKRTGEEPPQADEEEEVEEVEMTQAATKRPLPTSPLLPPLAIGADPSTEEIMGHLMSFNVANKGKLTPRDTGSSGE